MFRAFLLVSLIVLYSNAIHADVVDEYVNHQIRAKHIPAIAMVILKRGIVVKAAAYGSPNVEFGPAASLSDVYPIASITKLFTAVSIFLLVQDGKLHLDDKITSIIPGLPSSWEKITILNCLSHTSGIADFPQIFDSPTVPLSQDEAIRAI